MSAWNCINHIIPRGAAIHMQHRKIAARLLHHRRKDVAFVNRLERSARKMCRATRQGQNPVTVPRCLLSQ